METLFLTEDVRYIADGQRSFAFIGAASSAHWTILREMDKYKAK